MFLLVDIGNSRLKWTTVEADLMQAAMFMDYRQPDFSNQLRVYWSGISRPRQLAIASVSSNAVTQLVVNLAETLWPAIEVISPRPSSGEFGVKNAYAEPERLGIDRWLAMLAAHHHYPGGNWIVDCGTAITIDLIDGDGIHLGGVIGPGLWLMKKALAQHTVALPFSETSADISLVGVTEAAINNGTLSAVVGMVETVIKRQVERYGLILSGGDAEIIARHLSLPAVVDGSLVFKGLLSYCSIAEAQ